MNRQNATARRLFFFSFVPRTAYWRTESSCVRTEEKKIREIKFGNYRRCKIWTPLPIGATGIVASIYWRSAGIPIPNSSADFLDPLCRVLPIRQDITYWFFFTGAETEIHKIKDDSKINREKNIDRRGQRHIANVWHLSNPSSFSLPTTFKLVNIKTQDFWIVFRELYIFFGHNAVF